MLYRYEIVWINNDTREQETDSGFVNKNSYADAVNRIANAYAGPYSDILEIRIYVVENLLNDSEIKRMIEKSL